MSDGPTNRADIARRVTVSVLTFGRAPELRRALDRVLAGAAGAPVIVVDNGSPDATQAVVKSYSNRIQNVRLASNMGAAGRNVGVLFATTPYVALCDDDCFWAEGSLEVAARALDEHPDVAVVTARVLVGDDAREDPTCARMAESPLSVRGDLPGPPLLGFLAGASMVRRSAFLGAGGFEPRFFLGGEERLLAVDLASRGWQMAYLPEAIVHHHPSPARDAARRRALLARNAIWFSWLRRPVASALGDTAHVLGGALRDPAVLRGALEATLGVPWVARNRRVVPDEIERALRKVAGSGAANDRRSDQPRLRRRPRASPAT